MAKFSTDSKTFVEVIELTRADASDYVNFLGDVVPGVVDTPRFTHDEQAVEPIGILTGLNAMQTTEVEELAKIRESLLYFDSEAGRYIVYGTFRAGDPILYSGENAMVRANYDGYQEIVTGYVAPNFDTDVRLGVGVTARIEYKRKAPDAVALNIFEFLDLAIQELPHAV